MSTRPNLSRVALLGASLFTVSAFAGNGSLELQGTPPVTPLPSDSSVLPAAPAESPRASAQGGAEQTAAVRAINITGNTVVSTQALVDGLGPVDGRKLTLAQMNELAQRVAQTYHALGYPFVRAYLPPQRIQDGVLHIEVLEGIVGRAHAEGTDPKSHQAQPFLDVGVPTGEVIQDRRLERTMLLLNDEPGFRVHPVLQPGEGRGESDLSVDVVRVNHVSGQIAIDNTGAESTGRYRARADFNVNSPFMFGDQIAASGLYTDKQMWLGSIDYELPLGARGMRGQVAYSRTSYQLAGQFASLDASGFADTTSAKLSYPLLRSQMSNAIASLTVQHKRLEDKFSGATLSDSKRSDSAVAALQFDNKDGVLGGGVTYGQASLTAGNLSLDAQSRTADASTAKTAGDYAKLNIDVARIQRMSEQFSAYVRVSGQVASKNLDSSEKYAIGGYLGVRAYPMGEGSGDNAWLSQTEIRYGIGETTIFGFADAGQAFLNANPWDSKSTTRRSLAGVGLGVRWLNGPWSVESTLGERVHGGAPQSDSHDYNPRLYVLASYRF